MKVIELLDLIYNRKKDNTLSSFAIKFLNTYSLNEQDDIDVKQAIILVSNLSNKEKRNNIIKTLVNKIEEKEQVREVIDLRNNTYKQVCKFYHPDNLETGNSNMFRFVQEIKELLWDYNGVPKKDIDRYGSWESDKKNEKFYNKYGKYPDLFDIDSEEYNNL